MTPILLCGFFILWILSGAWVLKNELIKNKKSRLHHLSKKEEVYVIYQSFFYGPLTEKYVLSKYR